VLRALSSFIATLRDQLNGTANTGTVKNPVLSGAATGSLSGVALVAPTISGTPAISSTAVTWSGNPTHSGDHTWSGTQTWSGSQIYTTPSVGMSVCKVKTASTARSLTTTTADDPHLVQALGVGTWAFEVLVPAWGTTTQDGGLKAQMGFSGTMTDNFYIAESRNGAGGPSAQACTQFVTGTQVFGAAEIQVNTVVNGSSWARLFGTLTVTVAGNLSFKWSQMVSDADATNIGIGGRMTCTRLA
jgi:hypothetical protein